MSDSRGLVVQTEADRFPLSSVAKKVVTGSGFRYLGLRIGDEDSVREHARLADAVMLSAFRADSPFIESLERCKVIARCGVGLDNVDVATARRRGIVVTYVPDFCTTEVAEHALALLLACERRIGWSDREIRAGRWPLYAELGRMRGLAGATLGIAGFGRIGRKLSTLACALDMVVVAHDPYVGDDEIRAHGAEPVDEGELLARSEILSLHLPLLPATRHWLDARKLARVRRGVTIVNTARGAIIDEAALLAALDDGVVGAAGLDVFEQEPPVLRALVDHPNVVSTPHSAAFSEQALRRLFSAAAEDVVRVLTGQPPAYPAPILEEMHDL